jgi:hypothetical protein
MGAMAAAHAECLTSYDPAKRDAVTAADFLLALRDCWRFTSA